MPSLSLIIPVYNEREGIENTLKEIQKTFAESEALAKAEIVVVDDGSSDGTLEILKNWPGINLVIHEKNRGYGAALKSGIRKAKNEIIGITDADGTYPNWKLPQLFEQMLAENLDMLIASRTGKEVYIPLIRRPAKILLNVLANYLTERKIPDLNSGLRLFKRDRAMQYFPIISNGFSFTTTITLAMLVNDLSVAYVPIDYAPRKGRSKIRPIHDTFNFLILIVRTIAFFNPLKIFIPVSLVVFLLGITCLGVQLWNGNVGEMSAILILSSLQIFFIGLIADLISRKS